MDLKTSVWALMEILLVIITLSFVLIGRLSFHETFVMGDILMWIISFSANYSVIICFCFLFRATTFLATQVLVDRPDSLTQSTGLVGLTSPTTQASSLMLMTGDIVSS